MMSEILKKDKIFDAFVKIDKEGKSESIELEDLQQHISTIVLSSKIPEEVKRVFNGAKDLYLFGYFRYYFFTISNHYALLSLESALRNKYNQLFRESKIFVSFKEVVMKLAEKGIIKKEDKFIYDISRELRNSFSHLTSPPVITPADALKTLERVKEDIEKLF
ncbi:hypothetical protein HYU07_00755 [Candidatus Woesearchaeota archaeon]|nr:hypothetical protein [Candidatus Woesearchaeota archaeon]